MRFRHNLEVFVLQSYAEYVVGEKTENLLHLFVNILQCQRNVS